MQGLERLHYFNGQRLVAKDFELEQTYHMRLRRLLNRGLYTTGVVSGLQVTQVDARHVRVSRGVALDPGGRDIVLLADATLAVPNRQPSSGLPGYFVVIQYDEQTEPGVMADCREGSGTTPPSRIVEVPVLSWMETWPNQNDCGRKGHAADCAVVLAFVSLDASCQIATIDIGARQWASSALPRQVSPFALEGEKDIDNNNPKRLHFQIRGGQPSAVVLYLWADAISSLYYTELGSHSHGLTAAGTSNVPLLDHHHDLSGIGTTKGSPDKHHHDVDVYDMNLLGGALGGPEAIVATKIPLGTPGIETGSPQFLTEEGSHTHDLDHTETGGVTSASAGQPLTLTGKTDLAGNTPPAGSTPYQARGGAAYSYPSGLRVKLNGTDITGQILSMLHWPSLGDGSATHALVTSGTGGIDLLHLSSPVRIGAHNELEFRLPSGGGKVLYNLYVE